MLVLTRKLNENLVITLPDGRDVVITLTAIHRKDVRLGVTADSDIPVHRAEMVPCAACHHPRLRHDAGGEGYCIDCPCLSWESPAKEG